MSPPNAKQSIPLVLIITSIGVYLGTISPVVYLGDSGELTAAAFSLGIPHGSGYPLYSLAGKLFCMIPLGNVAFRMNLMSTCFAVITAWLVYSIIFKITSSKIAAFVGALVLAFTPVLWSQAVPAEVYSLHSFFVALLIRLLWWWDERREFSCLILFVFLVGLSFGNHLQTVMLAPAVLFIILSADRKALFNGRHFVLLAVFFVLALCVYLYLPIRTDAGAAIHWGDPNNLDRFLAHVTGRSHRSGYVLNKTPLEYLLRTKEVLWFVGSQFGVILLFALWGWLKLQSIRWQVFFVLVILFDFLYAIFLNTISLEITAFTLPACIALAILVGIGIAHVLRACESFSGIRAGMQKTINAACCMVPVIPLFLNFDLCDQSRNYTAYEHTLNIFRTLGHGNILFLEGDNNFFPVTYGRMVERMREDVTLYDRHNIIFKMPYLGESRGPFYGKWEELRTIVEKKIIEQKGQNGIAYMLFVPSSVIVPEQYQLVPYGILHQVVREEELVRPFRIENVWRYYASESFYDNFEKDFMNREICAYFYFSRGKGLFSSGQPSLGLDTMKLASRIGYDDNLIHSDIAIFLTDNGFFEEAHRELEKALIYHEDLSGVHNNWGYYYHKTGDHEKAIASFHKAIKLRPDRFYYYTNLAFALYDAGRKEESFLAFQKSLGINRNQPVIEEFVKKHGLKQDIDE